MENEKRANNFQVKKANEYYIELWDYFLRELEGPPENTPISDVPFDEVLNTITKTVFDLEIRDPYPPNAMKAVLSAICELSEKQQDAIKKIFFEGMTEQQASELTGVSQQAVNDRKNRAILQIKNNPHIHLVKHPIVGGSKSKPPRCPFERIDRAFERGTISKDERYRLWALYEVGALRRFA